MTQPVSRLAPCPCGSGRRYKDCHGSLRSASAAAPLDGAIALRAAGRLEEAEAAVRQLLAQDPANGEAHDFLGMLRHDVLDLDGAKEQFDIALKLLPGSARIHAHLSFVLLLRGDYAAGWPEFAWRTRIPGPANFADAPFGIPRWRGETVRGKRLLVHAEQGLGDTIQFARFLPRLAAEGALAIDLFCHAPLVSLLSRAKGVSNAMHEIQSRPTHDFHLPIGDLAGHYLPSADSSHWDGPYLAPDPQRVGRWRRRLDGVPRPRIGLAWRGNPLHVNDRNRSLSADEARQLLGGSGTWISLQLPASQSLGGHPSLVELGADICDWDDTAAIVECLDAVVSVDTAVAHLAGSMNKPVYLLVPFCPDWRWGLDRGTTRWYPSARLFRQQRSGDWGGVIAEVAEALREERRPLGGPSHAESG